ncbi:MAG: hypothetical protein K6G74_04280 [Bacilli bacterium]|nr:hypothetical protein [Bacilli bacterium]
MNTRVTKKALLLLATSLLLTGCDTNPGDADQSSAPEESLTDSVASNDSSSEKSSVDYTLGWDPVVDEEIRRSLGGNGLPFFDMSGDITIVHVDKTPEANAHILMTSTCAFDAPLVYNAKTQFERAGWVVSYNNGATPETMRMDAVNPEKGINLTMTGRQTARGLTPYIVIYYREMWNEPAKGTAWSNNTMAVLTEINAIAPHALPYLYMATYNDTAEKKTNTKALIKGGDWLTYELQILAVGRKAFSSSKGWSETSGQTSGYGHYSSSTYTWTKVFSDRYTLTAKLYGDAADGSFTSVTADDVVAYLEVTVTAPKTK